MFKTLGEKARQLDNFRKLKKSIDGVVVHSTGEFVEIYMDCSFDLLDVKILNFPRDFNNLGQDFINTFKKAKIKVTEILQTKSKEIFN